MKNISDKNLFVTATSLALIASILLMLFFEFRGVNALIVVHVILGSLAFVIGGIALISKKGSPLHRLTGKLFYISMTVSVSLTLLVSMMPNHVSPSLFQIGVLSLYFLIGGRRSLAFKRSEHQLLIDRILAYSVISVSLVIMLYSVVLDGEFYPLRTVFGSIGIAFGLIDLILFNQPQNIKRKWLVLHISKMLGGYTAAVTAFFVAQNILSGYYNWFIPTVFGLIYIFFWLVKLKTFKPALST
ncbi:DUF2306 domain-containing protein [Aliikangiella coralliicola]|uniref:DUF2306 domain-containing protein n=1 Tax=Aliikangiella coralliicola TaxID=2592383 RepID=A0A545UII8_9GAMM|nr:DUF2306 domain-containing protein [Aliikangiella coralliicola]TQV89277.1 DUF2306 domain-containing protein [Aliikangiella coralliicola]